MKMINDPKEYKPNNISFRITSSRVLEQYKNMQGFVLSEMKYGQYDFSQVSKEIALLYTDTAFKILLLIERLLIRSGESTITPDLGIEIIQVMTKQAVYMIDVVNEKDSIFSKDFVRIWKRIHLPVPKLIERITESSVGETIDIAYANIGSILIDSIDTVRFELYELDYMYNNGENPFLVITELCAPIRDRLGINLPLDRAMVYKEVFNIDPIYKLLNYTDSYGAFLTCSKTLSDRKIKTTIAGKDRRNVA